MRLVRYNDLTNPQMYSILPIINAVQDTRSPSARHTYVRHVRQRQHDVYIGRTMPGFVGLGWGNPFVLKDYMVGRRSEGGARILCMLDFTANLLYGTQRNILMAISTLQGQVLGCWCGTALCHGHVLHYLANTHEFF